MGLLKPITNRTFVAQYKMCVYNLETWKIMCYMVLHLHKLGGIYFSFKCM